MPPGLQIASMSGLTCDLGCQLGCQIASCGKIFDKGATHQIGGLDVAPNLVREDQVFILPSDGPEETDGQ